MSLSTHVLNDTNVNDPRAGGIPMEVQDVDISPMSTDNSLLAGGNLTQVGGNPVPVFQGNADTGAVPMHLQSTPLT